jgi:hypothetical protein
MITITDAIHSLTTGASFTVIGDEINWFSLDIPQPTQAEIDAEIARLQAEYDSQAYARARAEAYPSWQEQLDMMFHDQTEGSRTWLDAIEAVKEAHPK